LPFIKKKTLLAVHLGKESSGTNSELVIHLKYMPRIRNSLTWRTTAYFSTMKNFPSTFSLSPPCPKRKKQLYNVIPTYVSTCVPNSHTSWVLV
jgi:hypothetical protein